MRKLLFIAILIILSLSACCQTDQTFNKPVYFNAGFYLNGKLYLDLPPGGSVSGTIVWDSVLFKPSLYPPSSHEHPLLYKPLNYVPTWAELTGKPSTFPPAVHTHAYADITGKPAEIELILEIPKMAYLPLPQKTTAEINALVIPADTVAMVWDKTLGVLKIWNGSIWKVYIANQ